MRTDRIKFHRDTAAHIRRTGRSIIGVFPCEGDDGLPFAYTIGNDLKGLPELLVIGTSDGGFLDDLSRLMIAAGHTFEDGQTFQMAGARVPVKLIRANFSATADYTIQAGVFFGHHDYAVMQVLLPDRVGRFPGEPGCQQPYESAPVLRRGLHWEVVDFWNAQGSA